MHNLPDWFPEVWTDEVQVRAQQLKSNVADTVDNGGMFTGDTVYMPRIGSVDAIDGARFQELNYQVAPLDWIKVDADPKFLPIRLWDADRSKLSIAVVKSLAGAVVRGIARARDDLVIDALNDAAVNGIQPKRGRAREAQADPAAETITTIGDYSTVIDLDTIAHAYALLGENDVDVENEDLTFLTSFKNKINLGLDPLSTSINTKRDDLPWSKLGFRSSTRLPGLANKGGDGTGVDCYLYARTAATTAWNDEVTEINERLGAILSDMIGQWFQGGAAVKEPKALIRIKGKQNFTVTRKSIPVIDTGA